jgi:hypothetical protein
MAESAIVSQWHVLVGLLTSVTALEKRWKSGAMENPE